MRLRITKVDEYQFLTCLNFSLWGSKSARFRNWQEGDFLVFIVDKSIAGYAEVTGKPFVSNDKIWDDGTFPYRIPIKFRQILSQTDRVPILGEVRDALVSEWGNSYGWGILNQQLVTDAQAEKIIKAITSKPNCLGQVQSYIEAFLDDADRARKAKITTNKVKQELKEIPADEKGKPQVTADTIEESQHVKAQNALIELGRITGCSVWVASNDRNRHYNGKILGAQCLDKLPNMGLSEEAAKKIALIDIIWIRQNAPICAFEVETTTAIYSGILRMSDLISVVPALNVRLYIVAPKERQDKVINEITRPTFKKIGLNDFCEFIPLEELDKLLGKVQDLGGHIHPTIVDKIAINCGEEI